MIKKVMILLVVTLIVSEVYAETNVTTSSKTYFLTTSTNDNDTIVCIAQGYQNTTESGIIITGSRVCVSN